MKSAFPVAVPEIPVKDINEAAAYYESNLGFTLDWGGEELGLAGISKGNCRMFLANSGFRKEYGNVGPYRQGRRPVNCHQWVRGQSCVMPMPRPMSRALQAFHELHAEVLPNACLTPQCFRCRARLSQIFDLFAEESSRNVHAGELQVRPPPSQILAD